MQLTETEERRKEFAMKKTNKETNDGMAQWSFQERKRILVVTRNLPYPSWYLQVVKKRKKTVKSLIFLSALVPNEYSNRELCTLREISALLNLATYCLIQIERWRSLLGLSIFVNLDLVSKLSARKGVFLLLDHCKYVLQGSRSWLGTINVITVLNVIKP